MRETWVQSLGWEDPLEKGKATCSSILAWSVPWTVHGVAKSWTQLSDFHFTICDTDLNLIQSKIMIQMNLFTKLKETHRHGKETYGYQRRKEQGEG